MLTTARLTLRPAEPGDLPALHAIFSDPQVMRHWSTPPDATLEATAERLEGFMRGERALGPELMILHEGRLIGRIGLWRKWEVGYILAASAWGRGFASEALRALCAEAFARHPDCPAITADIDPRNVASGRVLEKAGFTVTHHEKNTFFINGEWSDSTYFSLPRPAPSPG
ncbi:GNAT family N-acetyltransferase [Vannielia litorea]|uniref:Protein N-acetyltransferase, RimJ/RimL family n=1 Tax=Vannielia litorea TaxID=1217970 RepID=A0A1N6EX75_9RHOB|nr:GNAT family N-acetyltransferase [Vannielia litorea]SIN87655.1 Protein N-acetyltransferase, RimJ/RimL family [Vannielia litorea]